MLGWHLHSEHKLRIPSSVLFPWRGAWKPEVGGVWTAKDVEAPRRGRATEDAGWEKEGRQGPDRTWRLAWRRGWRAQRGRNHFRSGIRRGTCFVEGQVPGGQRLSWRVWGYTQGGVYREWEQRPVNIWVYGCLRNRWCHPVSFHIPCCHKWVQRKQPMHCVPRQASRLGTFLSYWNEGVLGRQTGSSWSFLLINS